MAIGVQPFAWLFATHFRKPASPFAGWIAVISPPAPDHGPRL